MMELETVNRLLAESNLPRFTPHGFESAIKARGPVQVMRAVHDLKEKRKGVDVFLRNLVREHGAGSSTMPSAHGAPGHPPNGIGGDGVAGIRSSQAKTEPDEMSPRTPSEDPSPKVDQVKVFGAKAALCFESDQTRYGYHTVAIEAASAKQGPSREYDWSNKVRIQITKQELPMVAAVFLGMIPQVEYRNHGPQNNKGFFLHDQGGNLFARVFGAEGTKAIQISPEDAFEVSNLLLAQVIKNRPGLSSVDLMVSLRPMVRRKLTV